MTKIKLPKESKHLGINALQVRIRKYFESVPDDRKNNKKISLPDVLSSGFCLFSLKYSSLLKFETEFKIVHQNIKNIFNITSVPSDTAMRVVLDEINPELIRPIFKNIFHLLQRSKQLDKLSYKINSKKYYILSIDGSGYYSSKSVHGACCLVKKHRDKSITYYHQILGASIVSPDIKTVIPICPEPIIKQDGSNKNDCERNACSRLLDKFRQDHPQLPTIVVEDSLAANEPHIRKLREKKCEYVLGAKQGNHKFLHQKLEFEKIRKNTTIHSITEGSIIHQLEFINNIYLNGKGDLKINCLDYVQKEKGKKDKHWTWVTSFNVTKDNVYQIMRIGRSRWRIENETFNTLKNQGYNFEHNFGHGNRYLSTNFSFLMMLAFLVDQVSQLCSKLYQLALERVKSKTTLWEKLRSAISWINCESMEVIYKTLILRSFDTS